MEFKNQFEESIYNISSVVFGNGNTQSKRQFLTSYASIFQVPSS